MGLLGDGRKFDMGYIIFDKDGRMQTQTLAGNPATAWFKFFGRRQATRKEREQWRARGFRCHFVTVQQSSLKS